MEIGKIIKQARTLKQITQEELAQILKVSTQAVSRWECGINYPDITLIPIIANYLDITADELLGIDLSERKQNIKKIIFENDELINYKRLDESLDLIKQSLKKYPNDEFLLNELTKVYWHRMLETIGKDDLFDYRQKLKHEIIENALKNLEIAKDKEVIEQANLYLIYTYPRIGESGRLKALEIVNNLPSIDFSKELRLRNVLTGKDRMRQLQSNMLLGIRIINESFSYHIIEYFDDLDKKIEILKKNIELIKLMIGENLYRFNIPCSNYSFSIAMMYALKNDKINTVKYLNDAYEFAKKATEMSFDGEYDSWWIEGLPYKTNKTNDYSGNYKLFEDKAFDFIRKNEEFILIKDKYLSLKRGEIKK